MGLDMLALLPSAAAPALALLTHRGGDLSARCLGGAARSRDAQMWSHR